MGDFDIAPFALPGAGANEVWFERPRDVKRVVVHFRGKAPRRVGLSYWRHTWPANRSDEPDGTDMVRPSMYGWRGDDDLVHGDWQRAKVKVERLDVRRVAVTFAPLGSEFKPEECGGDGARRHRRTVGLRVETGRSFPLAKVQVFTRSQAAQTSVRVTLTSQRAMGQGAVSLAGYNARPARVREAKGCRAEGLSVRPGGRARAGRTLEQACSFVVDVRHMTPVHRYSHDDPHLRLEFADGEACTIDLAMLREAGPVWSQDFGLFVTLADDVTTLADYCVAHHGARTLNEQVLAAPEQTYGGSLRGKPRLEASHFMLACPLARQKFWLEPGGDLLLHRYLLEHEAGADTRRFAGEGTLRYRFGLERWAAVSRGIDADGVLAATLRFRRDGMEVQQRAVAAPLTGRVWDDAAAADRPVAAMLRFTFHNAGERPAEAVLEARLVDRSERANNQRAVHAWGRERYDAQGVPMAGVQAIALRCMGDRLVSGGGRSAVLRGIVAGTMRATTRGDAVRFTRKLKPGATCELVLKLPFVEPADPMQVRALRVLDMRRAEAQAIRDWRRVTARGATVRTPEPHLNALHRAHMAYVVGNDFGLLDGSGDIATSVGSVKYANFTNESCMLIHDLDQRGLHEEARRRLRTWLHHQGQTPLNGDFDEQAGVLFGSGGYAQGSSYVQHHGWALWAIAEHYFMTGDRSWLEESASALESGIDWITRQRTRTMRGRTRGQRAGTRGWEAGWLPAGALEDVGDWAFWMINTLTSWWGMDHAAAALAAVEHHRAGELRREADAFAANIRRGLEQARRCSPLMRLRDGRWVPTYPSRLEVRGRDSGWIREVLEGAVYLPMMGLLAPHARQTGWILDDFQDNRYTRPPFGYPMVDEQAEWFDAGGFSVQPLLLGGLLPHLMRDEPEVYVWMFFNAFTACYSEEGNNIVEHPYPVLGFHNNACFKTSDEANACAWLRYMFVWADRSVLHLGRAIPRYWLSDQEAIAAAGVCTRYGRVSVRYTSHVARGRITAEVDLDLRQHPRRALVRFRHPAGAALRSVRVNGKAGRVVDAARGDVDLTGCTGRIRLEARYR